MVVKRAERVYIHSVLSIGIVDEKGLQCRMLDVTEGYADVESHSQKKREKKILI